MCGIAGILNLDGRPFADEARLHRMGDSIVHRGPDGHGYFTGGPVGLAHRRLSIIDVSSGAQPMFNEDLSIVVVFNGEIYNHLELRSVLESRGHIFRTHSDTEVILHAYEEYGLSFPTQLTGMFALALWDMKQRRLVLTRDRVGIKPLYYTVHNGQLLFASEIKALCFLLTKYSSSSAIFSSCMASLNSGSSCKPSSARTSWQVVRIIAARGSILR